MAFFQSTDKQHGWSSSDYLTDPLLKDDLVSKGCDKVTPYANASIFSAITFSWISPLISLGFRKTLDLDDIPQVNSINSVFESVPALEKQLELCRVSASKITGRYILAKSLFLSGTKAYVAQTPWIQSGTIQENILFGNDMVPEVYDKVIEACCLREDLSLLSFGDQTVIGERGINLSGGQKQRIQIARAVYHDADK